MSEQLLNYDSLELIRGDINGSYTTVYSSGDATIYNDLIVKYFCKFATPGAGKYADSQPRSIIYTKTSLGNHVKEPYVMLCMSGRQDNVARMASYDHIVAGKVGRKGSPTENFFRNLELFEGRMATEADFENVSRTHTAPGWNRPILSGIRHNSNPASPRGVLSRKQIAAILHSLFSCLESGIGRTKIKIVSDSISNYEKRSMDILREVFCYLPYSLRSEIGFCSYAATDGVNMPTNVKLTVGEYEPNIRQYDKDIILLDSAALESYEPAETMYITPDILELINFLVGDDSDRIDFFEFIENYIGIRSPNIFCSPTICAQMYGVFKEGRTKGTAEWFEEYLKLCRQVDIEGSDSTAEEQKWTVETWLLYKLRPNHADTYFNEAVGQLSEFEELYGVAYDIKRAKALFKMQADWAKEAPVPDYVPPEDYEPRDDKFLQWIKSHYGDTSDPARARKLEHLLRSVGELRSREPNIKLLEKLLVEIHHEYEDTVLIPANAIKHEKDLSLYKDRFQEQLDRIKEYIESLNADHEKKITEKESEIAGLKGEYTKKFDSLVRQHSAELDELSEKHVAELEDVSRQHKVERDRMNAEITQLNAETAKLGSEYAAKLDELRRQHETELDSLSRQHSAELNGLSEKHIAELENIHRGLEDEYTEKLNELRKMYGSELEKLSRQHSAELDGLSEKHAAEMEDVCGRLKDEYTEKLNDLSEKHSTELEKLRRQYEDEFTEKLNERYGAELEKLHRQHEAELEDLSEKHSTELGRKENEISQLKKASSRKTVIAAVAALLAGLILMFCMTRFVFKWVPTDTDSKEPAETVEPSPELLPEPSPDPSLSPTPITLPQVDLEAFGLYPNDGETFNADSELETEPVGDVFFASGEPAEQLRAMISEAEVAGARVTVIKGFEPYDEEQRTEENRLLATGFVAELSAVPDSNRETVGEETEGEAPANRVAEADRNEEHIIGKNDDIKSMETGDEFPVDFSVETQNWLRENAYRFGFIEIKDRTFRYIGKEAAFYIRETGISLEEFINLSISEFRNAPMKVSAAEADTHEESDTDVQTDTSVRKDMHRSDGEQ